MMGCTARSLVTLEYGLLHIGIVCLSAFSCSFLTFSSFFLCSSSESCEFEKACKKREKMPAVSLFAKFMMSRPTLVADLKDRGIIVQKNVKGKPKVTGDAAADIELALSPLAVPLPWALDPGDTQTVDVTYIPVDDIADEGAVVALSDGPY